MIHKWLNSAIAASEAKQKIVKKAQKINKEILALGKEKWIEIIIGTLFAVWLGTVFNTYDPLCTKSGFAWTWLVPIMIALRYGVAGGLISSMLLIISWLFVSTTVSFDDFPKAYFIGGIIMTMICGEYNEAWQSKYRRLEQNNFYTVERLEQLTHHHYILKLSHDRLEQMVLTKPGTLRDALLKLNELVGEESKKQKNDGRLFGEQEFLKILSFYCQITKAAIFSVSKSGVVELTAAAEIGNGVELDISDPLVAFALEEGKISHINLQEIDGEMPSKYIIATTLKSRDDEAFALLVVESMPFFALHKDTLQMISVLIDYYMDSLEIMPKVTPVKDAYADIPLEFAKETVKLAYIERSNDLPSHIVALVFTKETNEIMLQIKRMQRKMDLSWDKTLGDKKALLTLMPLTDEKGIDGYANRISDWMKVHHGVTLEQSVVTLHKAALSEGKDDVATLSALLDRCSNG